MKIEEHAGHAEHAVEHGNKQAALLIAVLAAILAVCEQQAKRADIAVQENAILAADTWNEYQAKSVRAAVAHDLEQLAASLDAPAGADRAALRQHYLTRLDADQQHYEKDPETGKAVLSTRARHYEERRQNDLERAHTFDNAAAALELGIVLSTASVITAAKLLLRFGYVMGAIGVVLALFGAVAPGLLVF
ncbi:MAG: DUF4337 family protein [Rhodospirillales bacterium]|nr:DUF4337 family protein [Rhodospirillales bacterium]